MAFDLTGRSLNPLSEFVSAADFLLFDYLPDGAAALFDGFYAADPYLATDGANLILDCHLAFPSELALSLPGSDTWALVLGSAGAGWTALHMILTVGPDAALELRDVTLGLRFDPDVLRVPASGAPAEIEIACTIRISPSGFEITDYAGLTLAESALCGTDILVAADDVRLVLEGDTGPPFVGPGFRGVTFERLAVTIPTEYLALAQGAPLTVEIEDAAIGNTGFTGRASLPAADPPLSGTFAGFPCRVRGLELEIVESAIVAAGLDVEIRLEALEEGGNEKWVALDVAFGSGGGFSAEASAVQPEASSDPEALVTVEYRGAVTLGFATVRLTRENSNANDRWAVYFSGSLQLLIPGATWPKVRFERLGVSSDGELLLPEGSGIAFDSPLVVEWYFARLTVPKFRFGRPPGSANELQVQLSAEVALVKGLPAGVSVEGLTVRWDPRTGAAPEVSFSGIGVEFGVPGCFSAGIQLGLTQDGGSVEFRGQGHLELSALDMGIQIGATVGYDQPSDFAYLYLFADAKLLPTGLPIGQSGLAIFGFQGLIAYNMALDLDDSPVDERYYKLFVEPPIGITDISKWRKEEGQNALGIGVVFGTVDRGFSLNVKGLLAVTFPDLVLLLQAKANILKSKPDLSTESKGTLDALMVYDSREQTFTLDIVARWGMPSIVEVTGSARAFFDFDNPAAFYLRIGQNLDGKRVSANVIRWGNNWLFTAGFWFELNRDGVVTGVQVEVGMRHEAGGFWIEAVGSASNEMKLFWEPPQWEGSLVLSGRIGAGYRGLSIGISLAGSATVKVNRPLLVELRAEACFKALLWKACKGHTFSWSRPDPPALEAPIRNVAAKPRDWTLRVGGAPPPGGAGSADADDGVVSLVDGSAAAQLVQPHSEIVLSFGKAMVDLTGRFNEYVPLVHDGFSPIGDAAAGGADFSAAYELTSLRLVREPGGANQEIDLWGTWDARTPRYNSVLRLLSSTRFGHDGSLTESFADGVKLDYCGTAHAARVCIPLAGIEPGFGQLEGGHPYHWDTTRSKDPAADRRNDPFVQLLPGDRLTLRLPKGFINVEVFAQKCPPPEEKDPKPGPEFPIPTPGNEGEEILINSDEGLCVVRVCFNPGYSEEEIVTDSRRGGSRTQKEDWTVSPDARLLQPGTVYELTVEQRMRLRNKYSGETSRSSTWKTTFKVDRPPSYANALASYVAATYPSAGARPIYTGYDLALRFHGSYVGQLYKSAGQLLCIRLFDAQGRPVTDAQGRPVLVPATETSMPDRSVSRRAWEEQYRLNVTRGCIVEDLGRQEGETTLVLPAATLKLTPRSQYRAALVSDAAPDLELHAWDFTTSSFATFTALVTDGRIVLRPLPAAGGAGGNDFDAAARLMGAPTVAYVDAMCVSPVVSFDRERCLAILLEAPEPLEANGRLTIAVDGTACDAFPSADGTRVIVRPRAGGGWPAGSHALRLTWSRGLPTDPAELRRAVAGVLGNETVDFTVESGGI